MKKILGLLMAFMILSTGIVFAAGCEDVSSMEKRLSSIEKDIGEIKRVLISILPALVRNAENRPSQFAGPNPPGAPGNPPAMPPGRKVKVNIGGDPSLGSSKAKLVLVEFSDYECPFCARFYSQTLPAIKKEYIDTGKLRFVYKDFPLPFHKNAMKAASAAFCAGKQGKYFEMHNFLFENQRNLDDVENFAKKIGLNMKKFRACMNDSATKKAVEGDIAQGRSIGVGGTPTFVLGRLVDGNTVEGEVIAGAVPFEVFRNRIEALLQGE